MKVRSRVLLLILASLSFTLAALSADDYVKQGDEYMAKRQYKNALDSYQRAFNISPAPTTRWKLSATLLASGRYPEAVTHLRNLDLSHRPQLLAKRADAYIRVCKLDDARSDLAILEQTAPASAQPLAARLADAAAATEAAAGRAPAFTAAQALTRVCTHDPHAWQQYGRAALRAFDSEALRTVGDQLTRLAPDRADGAAYAAMAAVLDGNFAKGRQLAQRALSIDADCSLAPALRPVARTVRAFTEAANDLQNGDENGTIRRLDDIFNEKITGLMPSLVGSLHLLAARAHLAAGSPSSAEEHATRAITEFSRVKSNDFSERERGAAHILRAEVAETTGDYDRAAQDAQEAQRLGWHQEAGALMQRIQQAQAQAEQRAQEFEPGMYEALGLTKNATAQEIKSAYRKKTREYHPDSAANRNLSEKVKAKRAEEYQNIQKAYEILSDETTKRQYDKAAANNFRKQPQGFPGGGFPGGGFPGGFPGGGFPGGQHFFFHG